MLKYYLATQAVMFVVACFVSLPLWAIFLPLIALLIHLGFVLGVAIVGFFVIYIMTHNQRNMWSK